MIYSIIAFASIILATVSTILAVRGKKQLLWVSTLSLYIFSMLAGFSIGQITVGFTFVLFALAVGYTFHWIKNKWDLTACLVAGSLIGYLLVVYVDDYWLFFPLTIFL